MWSQELLLPFTEALDLTLCSVLHPHLAGDREQQWAVG